MERADNAYRERLLGRLVFCTFIWAAIHAAAAARNFITLLDCAFSGFAPLSIALGLAYGLSLLAVDALVCVTGSRTAAGVLTKFWAVCGVLTALSYLKIEGSLAGLLAIPLLLLTPCLPLSWLLEWVSAGVFTMIVFLLCLAQFLYHLRLWRRERPGDGSAV